jgi:DNA (cytosine-5)-methyltransferase 1
VTRPRLLDLYCGVGGAGVGYWLAGFDVVGVDHNPQPRNPLPFECADALEYVLDHGAEFDAIHASPPCQSHCAVTKGNRARGWLDEHAGYLGATRAALDGLDVPYVLENVPGAPMRRDLVLCGEMFGLNVIRHRWFELGGWTASAPEHLAHRGRVAGFRHGDWFLGNYFAIYGMGGGKGTVAQWQGAMGITWTRDRREIAEALPPAYTQHLGTQLAAHVTTSGRGLVCR